MSVSTVICLITSLRHFHDIQSHFRHALAYAVRCFVSLSTEICLGAVGYSVSRASDRFGTLSADESALRHFLLFSDCPWKFRDTVLMQ